MANTILQDVRIVCDVSDDCEDFDPQLISLTNDNFAKLADMGVGPQDGFFIASAEDMWDGFTDDRVLLQFVKTFVTKSVKLAFDPPANSIVKDSVSKEIEEAGWRAYRRAQHYT